MTKSSAIRKLLILANVFFLITLTWLALTPAWLPTPISAASEDTMPPSPMPSTADIVGISLEHVSTRPLFSPNQTPRTPELKREASTPAAVRTTINLTLEGVIHSGETRLALMRIPGEITAHRFKIGNQIQGWRVEAIHETSVILTNGGKRQTLTLREGVSNKETANRTSRVGARAPVAKRPPIRK